jgi:hypothetical protein
MAITRKPYAGGPIPNGWEKIPGMSKFIRPIAVAPEDVEPPAETKDDETMHIVKVVSLPGPTGKDGSDGKDGKDGKDGVDGKDGRDGIDGINGIDGKHGKDGKAGPKGLDGKDGKDGKDGEGARGIKKIVSHGSDMEIELTDGSKSRHKLATGGGSSFGGSSPSLGTMAQQNANAVAITGGAISGTSITVADNVFTLQDNLDPTKQAQFQLSGINTGITVTYTLPSGVSSASTLVDTVTIQTISGVKTFTGNNVFTAANGSYGTGATTGTQNYASGATITGLTKNVNIGTGGLSGSTTNITVGSANGSTTTMLGSTVIGGVAGNQSLQVNNVASAVNYLQAVGAVTGNAPTLSVQGTDTNPSLALQSKGTGAIDLAAGSSGVNISNGGTVTSLVRTGVGIYTTPPVVTISAPTTTGGVQATAVSRMQQAGATIVSGGTGYTVGDLITLVGGTISGQATRFQVTAVSSGVITAINEFNLYGDYLINPTNPVSVTGGTGTGATFNVTWYAFAFTITNAGGGYIEQPTVTLSGGGGSGTTAYAIVGSSTTIKSLGTNLSFNTPGGNQVIIGDSSAVTTDYLFLTGSAFGRPVITGRPITGTNVSLGISGTGVGGVLQFMTNNTAQVQAQVNHTASAVNYLNLTGAATGAAPTISAQGSDATVALNITSKSFGVVNINTGTGAIAKFYDRATGTVDSPFLFRAGLAGTQGGALTLPVSATVQVPDGSSITFNTISGSTSAPSGNTQFKINHTTNAVNYIQATGAVTTGAPELSAQGSDTNINLKLTPKGTGVLQFGTYTAGVIAQAGYITITDAGGTSRRLLVG